jgi:hypothetical protein
MVANNKPTLLSFHVVLVFQRCPPDPKGAKELSTLFHFCLLTQKVKFFDNDQNGFVAAVAVVVVAVAVVKLLSLSLSLSLSCKDLLFPVQTLLFFLSRLADPLSRSVQTRSILEIFSTREIEVTNQNH